MVENKLFRGGLHLALSLVLCLPCWQVIRWVSDALFLIAPMLDVLVFLFLVFFSACFCWFAGEKLAAKLLNWNMKA